jgi:hypothetical protein
MDSTMKEDLMTSMRWMPAALLLALFIHLFWTAPGMVRSGESAGVTFVVA